MLNSYTWFWLLPQFGWQVWNCDLFKKKSPLYGEWWWWWSIPFSDKGVVDLLMADSNIKYVKKRSISREGMHFHFLLLFMYLPCMLYYTIVYFFPRINISAISYQILNWDAWCKIIPFQAKHTNYNFFFIEGLSMWCQYYITWESNNDISYLAYFLIMDTIVCKDQKEALQIINKWFSWRSSV